MSDKPTTNSAPMKFLETIDDYTSLEQQIQDAWRFMAANLLGMKVKRELEPTRKDLFDYASGNSSTYGGRVAMTEAMRHNPEIRAKLLDPRKPVLDPKDHTDTFMLYLAAQIAGRPTVTFNDVAGQTHHGPGRILRNFATKEMKDNYVPHLGALQRLAALAREAGKVTLYKQAVQKAKDVRLAGLERAAELNLTREWGYFNHNISVLLPKPEEVKKGFDIWMELKHREYDEAVAPKDSETPGAAKDGGAGVPAGPTAAFVASVAGAAASTAGLEAAEGVMTKAGAGAPARKRAARKPKAA